MPGLKHSIRLLRPVLTTRRAKLLGEMELGVLVQRTTDTTPELVFSWPLTAPVTVTLKNEVGATFGPFGVVGTAVNVTTALAAGTYSIESEAQNENGVLDRVSGSFTIIPALSWDTTSSSFSSTALDWSFANG